MKPVTSVKYILKVVAHELCAIFGMLFLSFAAALPAPKSGGTRVRQHTEMNLTTGEESFSFTISNLSMSEAMRKSWRAKLHAAQVAADHTAEGIQLGRVYENNDGKNDYIVHINMQDSVPFIPSEGPVAGAVEIDRSAVPPIAVEHDVEKGWSNL